MSNKDIHEDSFQYTDSDKVEKIFSQYPDKR